MPDYTPVYVEGDSITLTASTAVSGGDMLEVTGAGTVGKVATLASTKFVGVASADVPSGGRVMFWCRGPVHESLADGTVTAGDQVTSTATAGRQVKTAAAVTTPTAGDVTTTRAVLGVALTTAADNLKVRWMLYG